MGTDRERLKAGIAGMLDAQADEHALGHQPAYARRYVLKPHLGRSLELMFEQDSDSPVRIWIEESVAGALESSGIKHRKSSKTSLYTKPGKSGTPQYGRHSALEPMPTLGEADLVCLQPQTLAEAGAILDHLISG